MKKLSYLIVLTLILGLVLTGCLLSNVGQIPTSEQSGVAYLTKTLPPPDDLVGLWHFSHNLNDSSGNKNHGVFSGTEDYVDSTMGMGEALKFNGVDDYVSIADSPSLDAITDLTVELWLSPTITYEAGIADYHVFVSKYGPKSFQFVYHPAGYLYLYVTNGIAVRSWNLTLIAGEWYHLAATFDNATGKSYIYVDGDDVTLSTTTQIMTANDSPLFIGARPSPSPNYPRHFAECTIDEVRIWKVALSKGQLGEVYDWTGFSRPVENPGVNGDVINVAKAGRAIPVKFSLNGDQGLGIFEEGYPKPILFECDEKPGSVVEIDETVTAGESSLSYDATADQYIYVWKTNKLWAGLCCQLVVRLNDGKSYYANFKFK